MHLIFIKNDTSGQLTETRKSKMNLQQITNNKSGNLYFEQHENAQEIIAITNNKSANLYFELHEN